MTLSSRSILSRLLIIALCVPGVDGIFVSAEPPDMDESQVRAMVIVNLTKFIDWPDSRNVPHSPFIICAAGNDQVGLNLESILNGKTVQGRPVLIRRGVAPEQAEACHVLYLAHPKHGQLNDLASGLASASVLTVSEEHQARAGTIIGLPLIDGHVQIEINRPLAQRSSLILSSHLLQIATEGR